MTGVTQVIFSEKEIERLLDWYLAIVTDQVLALDSLDDQLEAKLRSASEAVSCPVWPSKGEDDRLLTRFLRNLDRDVQMQEAIRAL